MPPAVLRLTRNVPSCPRLPDDIPDPALHFESMKVSSNDDFADVLVAFDQYKLWKSPGEIRVRWAQISWPDNGLGVCGHGAATDLTGAIKRCYEHKQLLESIAQAG